MLRVPHDLQQKFADTTLSVPHATVIRYAPGESVVATPALVTQPTFGLIRGGLKTIHSQHGQRTLEAPTGSIVALRSGTHILSEFHDQGTSYNSLILSIDQSFLRDAVGGPAEISTGPRVVVSRPASHVSELFESLPAALASARADMEKQFKIRELLLAMMSDSELRDLVFREVADWGSTTKERLVSVMTTHCLSPVQVPDLAALCGMSLSSFKRHVKATYGMSPGRWLTKVRLEHARSMVLKSDSAVSEIGEASGYQDVSSFIRAFRRAFGTTPAALRKSG